MRQAKEGGGRGPGAAQKFLLLIGILGAVYCVPYYMHVTPSISRSYVAGYSNRAAVLLLLAGTALFALYTRGRFAEAGTRDTRLPVRSLFAAFAVTVAVCLIRVHMAPDGCPGGETYYFLNRQQMLAAGLRPYRQFEFVYGPLLLYPNLWLTRLLHLDARHGYIVVWILSWLAGVSGMWGVVRAIDIAVPSRERLFWFLLAAELVWSDYGGLNYTPLRAYAAAFCVTATYTVWRRTRSPWKTAASAVATVALALAYSPDHAVGAAVGLLGGMLLLAWFREFPWAAVAATAAGILACFVGAARLGWLDTMKAFASGGYSYPVLPSFSITVALVSYIAAGCVLVRRIRQRQASSFTVPLTLAGCALLPSALGRSDILHITAAIPAFVVGTASLYGMPALRRWWAAAAVLGLVVVPFGLRRSGAFWAKTVPAVTQLSSLVRVPDPYPGYDDLNQSYVSSSELPSSALPCDRTYFSPTLLPVPTQPFRPQCLDMGYYVGLVDVITPQGIAAKVNELRARPGQPLLLENLPLDRQFPVLLGDMVSLIKESGTLWLPRRRNAPLTYAPIRDYIVAHYTPGPTAAEGRLRVWYPIAGVPSQR